MLMLMLRPPGATVSQGHGAPEIGVFQVEKDTANLTGQVASHSVQFTSFTHGYTYLNDTADK
jgi:hypothetical protein